MRKLKLQMQITVDGWHKANQDKLQIAELPFFELAVT
jgi:hypothetical protein